MAIPTSMAQLTGALLVALPTQYRPCVPSGTPDKLIHVSIGYVPPEVAPAIGQPTESLCGNASTVRGAGPVPKFAICTVCWEAYVERAKA